MKQILSDSLSHLAYFKRHVCSSIPYCLQIVSPNPGNHLVIVGGTHGNEPAGVEAIIALHRAFRKGLTILQRGKVSFLLGNPRAYENGVRYVDFDLNRAFDRRDASGVEGSRVLELRSFFDDNEDISALLDLHSVSIGDFRLLVYTGIDSASMDFAINLSAIPLHFVFHPEHMPGTLIEAASAYNIRGLIVECGNHYSRSAVDTARQHIYRFMTYHHLIDETHRPQETAPARITIYESIQAIKPHTGFSFLIENIQTGTRLKKGQRFAKDDHGYHIAPQDCYVVVPSKATIPTDADAGFLGRLTKLDIGR